MEGSCRHMEALDCIRFLPGGRLASKSHDGRMCVWDLGARRQLSTWKVRGTSLPLLGPCCCWPWHLPCTPYPPFLSCSASVGTPL